MGKASQLTESENLKSEYRSLSNKQLVLGKRLKKHNPYPSISVFLKRHP